MSGPLEGSIVFEGTYTAEFADDARPTPGYNYNQILYRLDLDDPRLAGPRTEGVRQGTALPCCPVALLPRPSGLLAVRVQNGVRVQKKSPAPSLLKMPGKYLAATYSHRTCRPNTIGAAAFHFRVRNGTGWFHRALATRGRSCCRSG